MEFVKKFFGLGGVEKEERRSGNSVEERRGKGLGVQVRKKIKSQPLLEDADNGPHEQGLEWYSKSMKCDGDGDLAHGFFDESVAATTTACPSTQPGEPAQGQSPT